MFDRYLNRPEATEQSFLVDKDGKKWFRTGDMATKEQTDSGFAYSIKGRLSQDIIKRAGFKISALDIEAVLLTHSSVEQVCVFGVPCDKNGEEIVAAVVMNTAHLPDVKAHCSRHLAGYKVPRHWHIVESLERN